MKFWSGREGSGHVLKLPLLSKAHSFDMDYAFMWGGISGMRMASGWGELKSPKSLISTLTEIKDLPYLLLRVFIVCLLY